MCVPVVYFFFFNAQYVYMDTSLGSYKKTKRKTFCPTLYRLLSNNPKFINLFIYKYKYMINYYVIKLYCNILNVCVQCINVFLQKSSL